jgi:orotate phosphoribosyltransferase
MVFVMISSQDNSHTLAALLKKRSLKKGAPITLASGKVSDIYVDCKMSTLHGPSLEVIGDAMWNFLAPKLQRGDFFVAGVSVGGDPLVAATLLSAARAGKELEGLLIRKEPKAHGASQGRAVDGFEPRQGVGVWLVEDVVSTGGSSLKAAQYLIKEGYQLDGILAILDREMGGIDALRKELGCEVAALLTLSQLL